MDNNKVIHTGKKVDADPHRQDEKLPHERDESVGSTDGAVSEVIQQAHRDISRGLQDTDRGPVTDRTYQKLKR